MTRTETDLSVQYHLGEEISDTKAREPYSEVVCQFLAALSEALRRHAGARTYPDLMSFAYWCRSANLKRNKEQFDDGLRRLGLGKVLHIAPSNVPITFVFTFALGLLAGNANIVRLSSKEFQQTSIVLDVISKLFQQKQFRVLEHGNTFVTYNHEGPTTGLLSRECDARVIWGGDDTIQRIRNLPTSPRCIDVAFADRYSFCIMNSCAVATLSQADIVSLAKDFYNDAYLMDQFSCSSPHLIVWLGGESPDICERFWEAVTTVAQINHAPHNLASVQKYLALCRDVIDLGDACKVVQKDVYVYRIRLDRLPTDVEERRGYYGYFLEYHTDKLADISNIVTKKCQSVMYYGFDKENLVNFVIKTRLSGVDRVVPVGHAADFDTIWDGIDVIKTLSRIISH